MLSSSDAVYKAYVKKSKQFSGRPDLQSFVALTKGLKGLSLATMTDDYKRNKAMNLRAMQKLVTDKSFVDSILTVEVRKMLNLFDKFILQKNAFYPVEEFGYIVPSVALSIMFGENYNYNDDQLLSIVDNSKEWFENAEIGNPIDFFNYKILQYLPNERMRIAEKCRKLSDDYVLERIKAFLDNEVNPPSILTSYLENYHQDLKKEKLTEDELLELIKTCSDMLGGGFETVAATLSWALLYLAKYPKVAELCRDEIIKVTEECPLSVKYESSLPYFIATIYEILRMSTVAPLALPRSTMEDVQLRSFIIPKDTVILPNLWRINHDPVQWKQPNELNPEHFLDDDGNVDAASVRKVASFSSGTRRCPGDKFAINEMIMLLGTIIKTYKLTLVEPPEDMLPKRGLSSRPKYYTLSLNRY